MTDQLMVVRTRMQEDREVAATRRSARSARLAAGDLATARAQASVWLGDRLIALGSRLVRPALVLRPPTGA